MKKLFLILNLTFFISYSATCQTIEKLDVKNGFKDFTLGDNLSKWQSQLSFEGDYDDDGSKAYLYTGECCTKIFNYNVEKIILRFSNNKLASINITTEKFQKSYEESGKYTDWRSDDFESIKKSFSILFGNPTDIETSKNSSEVTHFWLGKKVGLISKYENLGYKSGDRQQISIIDITALKSSVESGF
jgi:hypothetical protein